MSGRERKKTNILKKFLFWISLVVQGVKDLALSLQWLGLLLWYRFDPWNRNFDMLWAYREKSSYFTQLTVVVGSYMILMTTMKFRL